MQIQKKLLQQAYDPEQFRQQGHQLIDQLADYLQDAQNKRIPQAITYVDPEEEFQFWSDWEEGQSTDILFEHLLKRSVRLHHPRYMGHQVAPPLPTAALAGLVSDLLNNGMAVYEMGASATAIEKLVIQTVAQAMHLGEYAGGFLTSGGTLANLTALLTARRMQTRKDVWLTGTQPQYAIMVSEQAHYCVDRAVRIMGWGDQGVVKIPCDKNFRIKKELLTKAYQKLKQKNIELIAVVGSACSTSTGSFDDLQAIADFCETHNIWMHVDAAHGGGTVFSKKYRHLVAGIERADSVILDFHKLLMTPAITTAVLYKEGRNAYNTFAQQAQYLWKDATEPEWFNVAKRSFECTKTMMSVKVFSIINQYGTDIFESYIDQVYDNGKQLAQLIRSTADMELALEPACNIVCFRYIGNDELQQEQLNTLNMRTRQALLEEGRFYLVQTRLNGKVYLRVTLTNPLTTTTDLEQLVQSVQQQARSLATLFFSEQ